MRRKEIINVTNAPKCWGCDGCHCSQFLPFWLRRRAPFPQDDILSLCPCPTDTFLDQYMSMWSSSAGPPLDPLPGNQSFWDRPGLLTDRALIESSLVEPSQTARFLAAQAPHSGDWLLALPIANCGLRLDVRQCE